MSIPARQPSPEALALYAQYRDARQTCAPPACNGAAQCWVRDGPPALDSNSNGSKCLGCGDAPLPPLATRRHKSRCGTVSFL